MIRTVSIPTIPLPLLWPLSCEIRWPRSELKLSVLVLSRRLVLTWLIIKGDALKVKSSPHRQTDPAFSFNQLTFGQTFLLGAKRPRNTVSLLSSNLVC